MLITQDVHDYLSSRYGCDEPIERYAVVQADGESSVELYLTRIDFMVCPGSSFKFDVPHSIHISKRATLKELETKLKQVLSSYLYSKGDKTTTIGKIKLWKHLTGDLPDIKSLDKKMKNYTEVVVDACLLKGDCVEDMDLAPDDVVLIELPNGDGWTFAE